MRILVSQEVMLRNPPFSLVFACLALHYSNVRRRDCGLTLWEWANKCCCSYVQSVAVNVFRVVRKGRSELFLEDVES